MAKKPGSNLQSAAPVTQAAPAAVTESTQPVVDEKLETTPVEETVGTEGTETEGTEDQVQDPVEGEQQDEQVDEAVAEEQDDEPQQFVPGVELTVAQQVLRQHLDEYIAAMATNMPMTSEKAAGHQLSLFTVIQGILSQEGAVFIAEMDNLLAKVKANRNGVFSEYYVFRGLEHLRLTVAQRALFQRLIHLFINTCDPATRGLALEAIDLRAALASPLEDTKQQRLVAYYTA